MVVISIIALLVGILLPAISRARDNAKIGQSKSNIRNILCRHEQGEIFAAEGYAKVRRRDAHAHAGVRARTRTRARTPTRAHTHSLCSCRVDAGVLRRMRW